MHLYLSVALMLTYVAFCAKCVLLTYSESVAEPSAWPSDPVPEQAHGELKGASSTAGGVSASAAAGGVDASAAAGATTAAETEVASSDLMA